MSLTRRKLIDAYYSAIGMHPRRIYERIKNHEHMPRSDALALQQKYLEEQLRHCAANVPYYRNVLGGKAQPEIADFPVLTKRLIAENYEALLAENVARERGYVTKGSGTTGIQARTMSDRNQLSWSTALSWRLMTFFDVPLHAPQLIFTNSLIPPSGRRKLLKPIIERVTNIYGIESYLVTDSFCERITAMIGSIRPAAIGGLPSSLALYARYAKKNGIAAPQGIRMLRPHGESLTDALREELTEFYGVPVAPRYGTREAGSIAAQCEHMNYHQSFENVFLEVQLEDGSVATEGTGRLLFTQLQNRVMPQIRFDTGDIATLKDGDCPCGRGLPLLGTVHGRVIEMLKLANGSTLSATGVHTRVMRMNIEDFRLTQTAPDKLEMQVIPTAHYSSKDDEFWQQSIPMLFGDGINVVYRKVDSIPLLPSGKHLQVVNMMDGASAERDY